MKHEIFGGYPWYHREEVLFYDGFPWSTAVPERAALMRMKLTAAEAEEFVRTAYDETISHTDYLDGESATERRMREMYLLNMEYFMATLLENSDTKVI